MKIGVDMIDFFKKESDKMNGKTLEDYKLNNDDTNDDIEEVDEVVEDEDDEEEMKSNNIVEKKAHNSSKKTKQDIEKEWKDIRINRTNKRIEEIKKNFNNVLKINNDFLVNLVNFNRSNRDIETQSVELKYIERSMIQMMETIKRLNIRKQ